MIKFIKNLKTAIPPRARIMIFFTITIATASGIYMYRTIRGEQAFAPEAPGQVNVKLNPKESKIGEVVPGDEIIIPDDSPMAQTLSDIRDQRVDEAQNSRDQSFIEGFNLSNGTSNDPRGGDSIEDEDESIDAILKRRREEREKKRDERREQAESVTKRQERQVRTVQETQSVSEFVQQEVSVGSDYAQYVNNYVSAIKSSAPGAISFNSYPVGSGLGNNVSQEQTDEKTHASRVLGNNSIASRRETELSPRQTAVLNDLKVQDAPTTAGVSQAPIETQAGSRAVLSNAPLPSGKVHEVNVGNKYYSILNEGINTDEPTYLTATIYQHGPLNGAVLVGEPKRVGHSATVEFFNMALNGKDYKINAVAFDIETGNMRLADNVNRHIVQRYVGLGLSSFIEGYAEALVDQSTTTANGISQTITSKVEDPKERVLVAAGNVGEKVAPVFAQQFDREPTITTNPVKEIGVMFLTTLKVPL